MINWKEVQIVPRRQRHEKVISRWKYEGEYAFYNPEGPVEAEHPDQLTDRNSYVWIGSGGDILGHVSYGPDGQIPTAEGYEYSGDALDIGLGLRPDLCGRGLGTGFVAQCLRFGRERYGAGRFRLTVAAFNQRAVKVYQKLGFSIESEVTHQIFRNKFYIMTGALPGK